jgi:hypothetical protein
MDLWGCSSFNDKITELLSARELLSAWEALKMEQHEHSKLYTAAELVCDDLGVVQVCPEASSLRSHHGVAFERVRTEVKEALHLDVHRALAVFSPTMRRSA